MQQGHLYNYYLQCLQFCLSFLSLPLFGPSLLSWEVRTQIVTQMVVSFITQLEQAAMETVAYV